MQGKRDLLSEALSSIGWTRKDLGYRPQGYWARYPAVPFKMSWFDSLFAEPMRIYDWTRTIGNAVERWLGPEVNGEHRTDGPKNPDRMFQLLYNLAIVRRVDCFRNFSVNLLPRVDPEEPVLNAIRQVYLSNNEHLLTKSFGAEPEWPNLEREIVAQLSGVDVEFQKPIAACILNAMDARIWRDKALRNVPAKLQNALFMIRDFAQTQGDGIKYYPEVDDIAALIDEASLAYASMKACQAAEDCRYALEEYLKGNPDISKFEFETMTPYGRITIGGSGKNTHSFDDYFVLIDLGGDDVYSGPAGATTRPDIGISICVDLSGNDRYDFHSQACPSQGAGILGCGILYDVSGNDIYHADDLTQGFGFFGTGMLYDGDGNDEYSAQESAQGSGCFGHGLAIDDGEGDDSYYAYGECQGFGGCNGIGVLGNFSGNDSYYAEPSSDIVYRADYHSDFKLNVSNAQGCGSGRRGDGTDGHSWAGGLGFIADIHGNDRYEAGNFSMGCGYWFGTGMMYDKNGNDIYRSPVYTQASGAHYCIGALVDESGDDVHETWQNSTSALSFARDWTISFFVDKAGNDVYKAYNTSLCYVNIRSNAFFFDLAGNDHYIVGTSQRMLGAADWQNYDQPHQLSPFAQYCNSIALFIDSGGEDIYEDWTREISDKGKNPEIIDNFTESRFYRNNFRWESPSPDGPHYGFNNYGIGWDLEAGTDAELPDLVWLDPKPQ